MPLTSREVLNIMQNQVLGIRNEFISVIKDLVNKIDASKTEPTYFQTMENIMRYGEAQSKTEEPSSNLNLGRDHSDNVLTDKIDNSRSSQTFSSKEFENEYRKPYISTRENSKSRKDFKNQNMYIHHNSASTSNLKNSLDYTDSRVDPIEKSASQNTLMNRNFDYIQSIMGKENIGGNFPSYNQSNDPSSLVDDTPPCPSCVAKISKVFISSFNDSIQKLYQFQKPD